MLIILNQQKYKGNKVYTYIWGREGGEEKVKKNRFTARHGDSPKCISQSVCLY